MIGGRRPVYVVHPGVDVEHFDPARLSRKSARGRLGLPPDSAVLAVVGYLSPLKAQDDAIRIVAGATSGGAGNVRDWAKAVTPRSRAIKRVRIR